MVLSANGKDCFESWGINGGVGLNVQSAKSFVQRNIGAKTSTVSLVRNAAIRLRPHFRMELADKLDRI